MLKSKEEYLLEILKYPEEDNAIYLLEKFNEYSGLFVRNRKVLFLVKTNLEKNDAIKTEYLNLYSKLYVAPVAKESQFEAGEYNIIEYNGNFEDVVFKSYLELCSIYSNNFDKINFVDFFYSLVNMFQIPQEQQYKNLTGFYGELAFLSECLKNDVNYTDNWHYGSDSNAKYDFVFENCNADVKTILTDEIIVKLKYNQLFNKDKNYLIVTQLTKDNSGKSLNELLNSLKENLEIKNNYNFWLKVEKEKLRISQRSFEEERFSLRNIYIYDVKDINPFVGIADNVMNITFDIDLLESEYISVEKFLK